LYSRQVQTGMRWLGLVLFVFAAGCGGGAKAGGSGPDAGDAGGVQIVGPPLSTDPWPSSCVPAGYLDRPAAAVLLTGPSTSDGAGIPARPGESMTVTLNGLQRSFSEAFLTNGDIAPGATFFIRGYGDAGELDVGSPSLDPGTYTCSGAAFGYLNDYAQTQRVSNLYFTNNCCQIQITSSGGVGDPIQGTFSGILIDGDLTTWIKVEAGSFSVIRQAGPADAGTD
jgi:hypothetical protein